MKYLKTEIIVGIFMVMGIAAAVILSLNVAGLVFTGSSDSYTLKARFDNIGSLKLRAPVKIGGVAIGRVERIGLDDKTLTPVVWLSIDSAFRNISSDSKASILTAGIIGEQYIGITPGFYDEEMGSTYMQDGDTFGDTGSAVVLEDLIARFLYSAGDSSPKEGN